MFFIFYFVDSIITITLIQINSLANSSDFKLKFINFEKLNAILKPEYYNLFQNLGINIYVQMILIILILDLFYYLGRAKHGVNTLVKMRQDLLEILENKSQFK